MESRESSNQRIERIAWRNRDEENPLRRIRARVNRGRVIEGGPSYFVTRIGGKRLRDWPLK